MSEWYRRPIDEALAELSSGTEGLSGAEAERRLAEHGPNELPERKRSKWRMLLAQFQDVLVYILLVALALSVLMPFLEHGRPEPRAFLDAIVIMTILLLNAALGFAQEFRAEQAIAQLRALTAPSARVRRDGREQIVASRVLVPGDLVVIEAGDRISADGRVLSASELRLDESSLTGESDTVAKSPDALEGEVPLAERSNMVFAGTLVTAGSAEVVVTATGVHGEIGRIAQLMDETETPETPLQRRLRRLGIVMGQVVLALCVVVVSAGLMAGMAPTELLLTAVSLAVSAVPEGLPAVVTLVFALGVQRMVRHQAIVRRLDALEALGSVTVICSDKTGTITENRMQARAFWVPGLPQPLDARVATEHHSPPAGVRVDAAAIDRLALVAASCNRAKLPDLGDPTELGLLRFAHEIGVERLPIDVEELPFSSERKCMRTRNGGVACVKGAPEVVMAQVAEGGIYEGAIVSGKRLEAGDTVDGLVCAPLDIAAEQVAAMAAEGLRVLACAEDTGFGLCLVGLIGMEDPPRATAAQAMAEARRAGIRTIMITGDNSGTAQAIARQVGLEGGVLTGADLDALEPELLRARLPEVSVFARVSPEHKLRILEALRDSGEVVAMTGDGVNDAPALRGAHVGIAMGQTGTEVAREAASIVLTDDRFATIVSAVREGRRIYDNIRKFVLFLLRANFAEIPLITTALLIGLPLPYLPLHILWINLMTDSLPALALGVEPADPDVMDRPPRPPKQSLLEGEWLRLAFTAMCSFLLALHLFRSQVLAGAALELARSMTLTMAICFELLLAQTVRSHLPLWRVGLRSNPWMLLAMAIPLAAHLVLLYTPLASIFHLAPLDGAAWLRVLSYAGLGFLIIEASKIVGPRLRGPASARSS